jgi:hypothetical protein
MTSSLAMLGAELRKFISTWQKSELSEISVFVFVSYHATTTAQPLIANVSGVHQPPGRVIISTCLIGCLGYSRR